MRAVPAWADLYWLPLGAGGHFVRRYGRAYECLLAWRDGRPAEDLYHTGLRVGLDEVVYTVEMGPVWNVPAGDRGVVCQGPVGARWLGRSRFFRYEVRCWAGGRIPDVAEAVDSPVRVASDRDHVAALLAVLRGVPVLTWGRDERETGEMWNSNSVVAWALARSGCPVGAIRPPDGGRAPGWQAGEVLARRELGTAAT